jgi:hypothetical protein
MAFDINYMARVSSSANNDAQKMWMYNGTSTGSNETVATIVASGYFNSFMQNLTLGIGALGLGDIIIVNGNDGAGMYQVDAVTTNVTVAAFEPTGIVDTANLANGAVTADKLASDSVITAKILNLNVTTAKIAANAVTSAKISADVLQYAAVAVSAAEFNGMYAAPKLLVAAAGADTLLVLDRVVLAMTYNSAAFAAGGVAHIQYNSTANGAGVIASTTLAAASFQDTASTVYSFNAGVVEYPFATCANTGLYLSNITGAFTTGDSDFVAHVWYKAISLV